VAETANQETEKTWTSTAARFGWVVLILTTLYVCYFSHLGAIGFVGPDEPRYAWIARDMMETGDWVTPRLYGKPWFEKPPLFYWGAALCFKLLGVSEAAARLSSAISALLATLALAWLALRLYGAETARWLLLLLPTTVGMIGFSHAAATDMPFSGMLTIAMVAAAVLLGLVPRSTEPASSATSFVASTFFASVLFGLFLGLAVLAKGPAAIILCGGAIFFWALFTKRWRDTFRLFHPAGISVFCVTALPWYVLCARRNPDFFRIFIIEHNFKRYLTPEFQHIQPFWFYMPILLIAFLPWTLMLASLARDSVRVWTDNQGKRSILLFLGCWIVFTVAFFSASQSKLPGYILPALPALSLLMSETVSRRTRKIVAGERWIGVASGITLFCFSIEIFSGVGKVPFAIDYFPPQPLLWVSLADFLIAILTMVLALRRRVVVSLVSMILALILTIFFSLIGDAGWSLDLGTSARWATAIPQGISREYWTAHTAIYKLPRSFHYGLNFYMHKEVPDWSGNTSERNWVFTTPKEMKELGAMGLECSHFMAFPPVVVCEAPGSAARTPDGGKPQ
jgi:4-amino-4-deoxy-L-arabinose transferase-like glycosyltransferase